MEQTRRTWLAKMGLAFLGIGLVKDKIIVASDVPSERTEDVANGVTNKTGNMKLGAFSVSLNVKDLNASKQFYEHLGFTVFGGSMEKNYLIMKNGNALIGLFHGMFEKTILTFNPGWDESAKKVEGFADVRDIQRALKANGIVLTMEADEKTAGPASLMLVDPDGNQLLIDQHV